MLMLFTYSDDYVYLLLEYIIHFLVVDHAKVRHHGMQHESLMLLVYITSSTISFCSSCEDISAQDVM
jgi:hypothetical protein